MYTFAHQGTTFRCPNPCMNTCVLISSSPLDRAILRANWDWKFCKLRSPAPHQLHLNLIMWSRIPNLPGTLCLDSLPETFQSSGTQMIKKQTMQVWVVSRQSWHRFSHRQHNDVSTDACGNTWWQDFGSSFFSNIWDIFFLVKVGDTIYQYFTIRFMYGMRQTRQLWKMKTLSKPYMWRRFGV